MLKVKLFSTDDFEKRVASATIPFLLFIASYVLIEVRFPPTQDAIAAADPLVKLFLPWSELFGIAIISTIISLAWLVNVRPDRSFILPALKQALGAAMVAGIGLLALRFVSGDHLPAFIPPEESAEPGLALGLGAAVLEESLFRFVVLPALFIVLARRLGKPKAFLVSSLATGLLFAVSHEFTAAPFVLSHFVVRVMIPGFGMSMLFFALGPAFLVALHCFAHFGIAYLFI